jgi:hypothetical protein
LRDYFAKHSIYDNRLFQHQYQMHRPLFLQIIESICAHDPYFVQKIYACSVTGLSSIKKCTNVLCMLAYGQVVDACNEYCRIREAHHMNVSSIFVSVVKEVF